MSLITGSHPFAKELCEALSLPKHTRAFELRVAADDIMTIKCEFYPELPDGKRGELLTLVRRFDLVEKYDNVTVIGDQAKVWQLRDDDDKHTRGEQ